MSFFKELKRRNVFKVTIAYVVMAWLVMQIADVILNNVEAPGWVFHVILLLLGIGLLLAIFFAWAYELTPEGIKKEKDIDRTQSITHVTARKLDFIIIGVMAVALGYFAYDKLVLSASREAAMTKAITQAVGEQVTAEQEAAIENDKSIAVLPFVNMSDDAANEYFSDGISEELLNLLVKIPEFRVISRSSAFSYKGKDFKIADVGRELNVAYVLEGSVRKDGNKVRVTAQLIEVDSDTHQWSDTYDRTLEDIFAIQDEIASKVVEQLKVTLLGAVPVVRETDPQAYALYLKGRHLRQQDTAEGNEQALALLQQALAIDPGFVEAWDELGTVYFDQGNFGWRPMDESHTLAREAFHKALAIDPDHAPAHSSLGYVAMVYGFGNDLAGAARHIERALQLEPANTDIIFGAAGLIGMLDRPDEALALIKFAVSRDPVNPYGHLRLGGNYYRAGRWDEAIASYRTAQTLTLSLGLGNLLQFSISQALLFKGEPQATLEVAMQLKESFWGRMGLPMAYHALGQKDESDAALAALIEEDERFNAYSIAGALAYRGEADLAFEWLDKAVEYKDMGLTEITGAPEFANIQNDPRWLPFLESIGRSPEQLAAIEFKVTLPN